jgi:hypothetical protein
MPRKGTNHRASLLPRGDDVPICTETVIHRGVGYYCGKRHLTRRGVQACSSHVRTDRTTYAPGEPRDPLPQPRPCQSSPFTGMPTCQRHGINRAHREIAARRESERKAAEAMRRFGGPIDTTPSEALLDTVKWTAGYVGWLREKVAGLDETVPAGETEDERRARDEKALTQRSTQTGKQEASAWVDLLGTWHDKLVKVCEAAIRAGIEERRVRIAEQQGALVADVIRKILGDLELTPEQASKAGEAVPRHLRLLAN